jgi:hypothetical protein
VDYHQVSGSVRGIADAKAKVISKTSLVKLTIGTVTRQVLFIIV